MEIVDICRDLAITDQNKNRHEKKEGPSWAEKRNELETLSSSAVGGAEEAFTANRQLLREMGEGRLLRKRGIGLGAAATTRGAAIKGEMEVEGSTERAKEPSSLRDGAAIDERVISLLPSALGSISSRR